MVVIYHMTKIPRLSPLFMMLKSLAQQIFPNSLFYAKLYHAVSADLSRVRHLNPPDLDCKERNPSYKLCTFFWMDSGVPFVFRQFPRFFTAGTFESGFEAVFFFSSRCNFCGRGSPPFSLASTPVFFPGLSSAKHSFHYVLSYFPPR